MTKQVRPARPYVYRPRGSGDVGVVYLLGFDVFVKIGFTRDLVERTRSLQTAVPLPLEVYATMPGTTGDEARLHRQFAATRSLGDWFYMSDEIAHFIISIRPPPNPVMPRAKLPPEVTARLREICDQGAAMRAAAKPASSPASERSV